MIDHFVVPHVVHVSSNANAMLIWKLKQTMKEFLMSYQAINATKHGMSRTRQYRIWRGMRLRCEKPRGRSKRWYSGVSYDPKWKSFEGFWEDMADGYSDHLTLDRIDPSQGYSKSNCRWVDMKLQSRNRRDNVWVPYKGQMLCASDYADEVGLPRALIYQRIKRGVPIEELDAPSRKRKH